MRSLNCKNFLMKQKALAIVFYSIESSDMIFMYNRVHMDEVSYRKQAFFKEFLTLQYIHMQIRNLVYKEVYSHASSDVD